VLACSEEPASQSESLVASRVDSTPPSADFGVVRRQSLAAARKRKALEAFDRWTPLLASGSVAQARVLCEAWLGEPDEGHYGEAHKCLANVEIASARGLAGASAPGRTWERSTNLRATSNSAVAHYDAAIAAMPLDLDAHIGRVDILILAGRYREANRALDESLGTFSSRALLDKWFRLLGRFQRSGDIDEGLDFLKIIERHHPLDHRVVSNLGALYAMTGNGAEALAYSERAVALNPDDPINKWNLARIYDRQGRIEDANRNYLEALAVFGDADPKARCDYAEFIGTRLGDAVKACQFAKENCSELFDEKCPGNEAARVAPEPGAG
jgi:tetratricopeptide (TPR) repeat protein